jgi:hypothetical protein
VAFLHTVVKVYKQNPFMVSSVAVFSLISFVFVIVIFSLTGGHETTLSAQRNLFSGGDDALFSNQYAKSKTKYDLNVIALNVIEGKAWDKHHIDDFAAGWNRLSATEKNRVETDCMVSTAGKYHQEQNQRGYRRQACQAAGKLGGSIRIDHSGSGTIRGGRY